jgi:hypothetical protein
MHERTTERKKDPFWLTMSEVSSYPIIMNISSVIEHCSCATIGQNLIVGNLMVGSGIKLLTSWQPGSRDSRKGPGDKTCPSKACCP